MKADEEVSAPGSTSLATVGSIAEASRTLRSRGNDVMPPGLAVVLLVPGSSRKSESGSLLVPGSLTGGASVKLGPLLPPAGLAPRAGNGLQHRVRPQAGLCPSAEVHEATCDPSA